MINPHAVTDLEIWSSSFSKDANEELETFKMFKPNAMIVDISITSTDHGGVKGGSHFIFITYYILKK